MIDTLAGQRQHELRSIAHPKGARLFAESPKALHHRIATYWNAAVTLKEREPNEDEPPAPRKPRAHPVRRRRPAAGA